MTTANKLAIGIGFYKTLLREGFQQKNHYFHGIQLNRKHKYRKICFKAINVWLYVDISISQLFKYLNILISQDSRI